MENKKSKFNRELLDGSGKYHQMSSTQKPIVRISFRIFKKTPYEKAKLATMKSRWKVSQKRNASFLAKRDEMKRRRLVKYLSTI